MSLRRDVYPMKTFMSFNVRILRIYRNIISDHLFGLLDFAWDKAFAAPTISGLRGHAIKVQ